MSYSLSMPMQGNMISTGMDPMMIANGIRGLSQPAQVAQLTPPSVATPGAVTPNMDGSSGGSGFGFNVGTGQLLLGGLQTIGSLWNAFEARNQAKKEFAYKKEVTEANLKNQIQSYNTTLEDRSRSRAFTEGQSAETAQAYVDKNRLTR